MKRLYLIFSISVWTITSFAQNIGISNDAAFTTPQSPLHIYWTSDGNLLQLSRSSAANTGLLFSVSGNDYSLFNRQNGALIFGTNATEWMRILNTGKFGIGTNSPNVKLDINGDLALREGTALSLSNGANNDVVIGTNSFYRISGPAAAFIITGLSGGYDGKMVTLYNSTGQQLTISNQNASSAAVNRIITTTGADVVTPVNTSVVQFQYNATLSRWIIVGGQNIGAFPAGTSWGISGNAGTTAGTNYIGTSDVQALDFRTSGTVRARILSTGNFGIGTTTPTSLFSVGASSQFQIDNNGNAVKINNVTYSWPASQGAAKTYLQNDGSGNLSWDAPGSALILYTGYQNWAGAETGYFLGYAGFIAAEAGTEIIMPACSITRFRIYIVNNTLTGSSTFNLRKNGITVATITVNAGITGAQTWTGSVSVADGDLLTVQGVLGTTSSKGIAPETIVITYLPQ